MWTYAAPQVYEFERGEWRATATAKNPKHVSFHVWAGYSYSPNSTWGHIAAEWLDCEHDSNLQKTFYNTVLGETWAELGDVPEFRRLYERRELWPSNSLEPGVVFLTCGVDVQKDRLELEIVGWGRDKQSWSVDYRIISGETHTRAPWLELDKVLNETWKTAQGNEIQIRMMAVDAGYNTTHVYEWVRRQPADRVRAIKGSDSLQMAFGQPKDFDVGRNGTRIARASKVWPVGVSVLKSELYAWLGLDGAGDTGIYLPGFCHFPQYDEEYFKRLCSEQLMKKKVNGRTVFSWIKIHERNEPLDTRVYARAAAAMFGLDRFKDPEWDQLQGTINEPPPKPVRKSEPSERFTAKPDDFWKGSKKIW